MTTYIAILRGINVSGQKIIKMELLRESLSNLGFRNVQTYIQSGNVIFQSPAGSSSSLCKRIAEVIQRDFKFSVPVLVKTSKEMKEVIQKNPFLKEKAIDHSKLHVTFLSEEVSKTALKSLVSLPAGPDRFRVNCQEIYLYCPQGYGNTKLSNNTFERLLSVEATTRNWKTVNTLSEMALKLELPAVRK